MFRKSDPNRHLSRLIRQQTGLKGTFTSQLRQVRPLMPHRIRQEADLLTEFEALAGNPHIARQMDANRIDRARQAIKSWLLGPALRKRQQRRRIGLVLSFGVSLLLGMVLIGLLAGAG